MLVAVALVAAPVGARPAAAQIAEEKKLGEQFLAEALPHIPLIHDFEAVSFIRDIGTRLVKTLGPQPFDYEFFVVLDDSINAFAVPGGKLFAHAGLIARVDSEDELAGVMGHEVAHAAAHHIVRQQQKGAAAGYASLLGIFLGIIHPGLAVGAMAAGQAAQLRYQRDFEREADFLGVGYAREAGYEPAAIMRLLRKIHAEQQMNPTQIPPYFLSHPLSGERLTNLEAVLGKREWDEAGLVRSHRLHRVQAIVRGYAQTREQAVPDFEKALAAATPEQRPVALELIGVLMAHGEDYALAEKHLREAEAAGRNVDRELGRTAFRRGRLAEARERLERVLARTPGDWDTLADLAAIDYEEGAFDKAAEKYERSVALESYRVGVLQNFARALGKSGREGAGFYWFGRAGEMRGNNVLALSHYRRAVRELPKDDPLREDIERRSEKLGDVIKQEEAERGRSGGSSRLPPGSDPGAPLRLPGPDLEREPVPVAPSPRGRFGHRHFGE